MKILRHGWNVRYGNNKSNKGIFFLLTMIFKRTMGTLMTCHVINMEFVVWRFYHCVSRSDAGEKCVDWLSLLSASTRFHPIWRLPMTQVGEIPSSYSYLIISLFRLVFYTVALVISLCGRTYQTETAMWGDMFYSATIPLVPPVTLVLHGLLPLHLYNMHVLLHNTYDIPFLLSKLLWSKFTK